MTENDLTGLEPQLSQNHNGDEPMLGGERRIEVESESTISSKYSPTPQEMLERWYIAQDEMNFTISDLRESYQRMIESVLGTPPEYLIELAESED